MLAYTFLFVGAVLVWAALSGKSLRLLLAIITGTAPPASPSQPPATEADTPVSDATWT